MIIILAVLSTLFVASIGFPADDCLDCTDAKLIESLTRLSTLTSENRIFNEQDVKRAFELALDYLNPPTTVISKWDDLVYHPPETEIEKLKRLSRESKAQAEKYEQRAKDIEFIKKVYEDNF